MNFRPLGRTGVIVSSLALGTMTFGKESDEPTAHAQLDRFVDAGGNLVDTADVYQSGDAEEIVGRWLAARPQVRDAMVLATKCRFPMNSDPNAQGLSRRWVVRACEASLRRLGVDHIDLYQAHCWDPLTPVEETLAAFDDLVRAGKVRYVGVSNMTGWQLQRYTLTARLTGRAPVVSMQPQYSLLERGMEAEIVPLCLDEGVAVLPWGPLGGGWLTGKYSRDRRPQGATRLGEDPERGVEAYDRRNTERTWRIVDTVARAAEALGTSPSRVALAWVHGRPSVTSVILGARTLEQLEDNLGACDVDLGDWRWELDRVSRPELPGYPYGLVEDMVGPRRELPLP